jgi:hypothetical protein
MLASLFVTIYFYELETGFRLALRFGVQLLCSEHWSKDTREPRNMGTTVDHRISSFCQVDGSQRND